MSDKIITLNIDDKVNYIIKNKITKGLYFTSKKSKIKKNCVRLGIEYPTDNKTIISKRGDYAVITSVLKEHKEGIQLLLTNEIKMYDLETFDFFVNNDFIKQNLLKAIELLETKTLMELLKG
jgi:hypothetical protein